jgi:hypothetical protein
MTQEDYLKMSDEELTKLAEQYRIPSTSFTKEDPDDIEADFYFDREKVVEALIVRNVAEALSARDEAVRARRTTIISVVALLVSFVALLVSILK